MDPHAEPGAGRLDPFVRADARELHSRARRRRPVDPRSRGLGHRSDSLPRDRADRHGARRGGDDSLLQRVVRRDGVAPVVDRAQQRRLHPLQPELLGDRARRDAAGDFLRGHDAAAHHLSVVAFFHGRARARHRVCGEYPRVDPRRGDRRARAASMAGAARSAHCRGGDRRRARRAAPPVCPDA